MKAKKFLALLLSAVLLFSFTVPAFAAEETTAPSDAPTEKEPSLITKILDILHGLVEKICEILKWKCPFCKVEYEEGSPEAICAAYNEAVNDIKAYDEKVKVTKKSNVSVAATELPSVSAAIVNKVLEELTGETEEEYTFENGTDVAESERKLADKINLAYGHDAELKADYTVKTLQYNKNGKNEYRITLAPEKSVLADFAMSVLPEAHQAGVFYIDIFALDLGPISVKSGEINYPETVIILTTDSKDRVTDIKLTVPFEGMLTGKAGIDITCNISGTVTEEYTFEYIK